MKYIFKITHKQLRKKLYWSSSIKGDILIKDMDNNHLINTCKYLIKEVEELYKFELPILVFNDKSMEEWIEIFRNEIKYRKLY